MHFLISWVRIQAEEQKRCSASGRKSQSSRTGFQVRHCLYSSSQHSRSCLSWKTRTSAHGTTGLAMSHPGAAENPDHQCPFAATEPTAGTSLCCLLGCVTLPPTPPSTVPRFHAHSHTLNRLAPLSPFLTLNH